MGIQVPDVNGFEATAAIRKREVSTGKHVPIESVLANKPVPAGMADDS